MPKATVTLDGDVAELVLSGPPLNLFDAAMITDVESAIAGVATHVREHRARGVAAADAITPRAAGAVFATDDLPAGLASLLREGPGQAVFTGR
jgi:hypothetical protein